MFLMWSSFSGGVRVILENVRQNGSSDNFVIICIRFVTRDQEKSLFFGFGSSLQRRLWLLQAPCKEPSFRCSFGRAHWKKPQEVEALTNGAIAELRCL
jgi:hypothetical protein